MLKTSASAFILYLLICLNIVYLHTWIQRERLWAGVCYVQAQYGYIVVQMLMNHLDENAKKDAQIKASIVEILSVTVLIAAGGSIGNELF